MDCVVLESCGRDAGRWQRKPLLRGGRTGLEPAVADPIRSRL